MRFQVCITMAFFLVGTALSGAPDATAEVAALLQHAILSEDLPLREVQAYTEGRVEPVPAVTTAAAWRKTSEALRTAVLRQVVFRGEAASWRDAVTGCEWLQTIAGGPGYRIRKLRYEALPGMWIPAVLYEPEGLGNARVPVVMNVNGHEGSGKVVPYKQVRCINQARRGMIALNVEWLGMGQLRSRGFRHAAMNQLDLCGTSGLAPFYLSMKRGLDVLLSLEHADPSRVAVAGLSGGGWQTIIISSLDTRVTLSNPVAGYSSYRTRARHLSDLGDSEQTPVDLAMIADYATLTAMRAPRPTLLTYNETDDCCFAAPHALPPLLAAARPVFALFNAEECLRWHINDDPGTHNFKQDNREALYGMFRDFFYGSDGAFDAREIPVPGELKTKEQLHVELPPDNEDFHTLALRLCENVPRRSRIPTDETHLRRWREAGRSRLSDIVRAESYRVSAHEAGTTVAGDVKAIFWRLKLDDQWTVPAVELTKGQPKATVMLVADAGRSSGAGEVMKLIEGGYRVVAVDPFYFGESRISRRAWLFALLVSSVGSRPLGLQASQLGAVARWLARERRAGPVRCVAVGPRLSVVCLVAAALEENAIGALELHGALSSLKEVIKQDWSVDKAPELFCFGLLERFDVAQLIALVRPRPVTIN